MSRTKFRAWDNQFKHWVGSAEYVIDPYTGNFLAVAGYEILKHEYDVTVEQYTGIDDVNEKGIYTGDIVAEITQFDDDEPDLYEVVYNETGDYPAFDLKGWTGEVNGISELSLTCGIKVVGNIHENIELLEK